MPAYLKAQRVTLSSELKFFGLDRGATDGSAVTIEFEISGGYELEWPGVKKELLEEKEKLDLMVLGMEYAKGSCTHATFSDRKARIKKAYDLALKREPKANEQP